MSMAEDIGGGPKRSADEAQLGDHAHRLSKFPTGWRAVYVHLSNLRPQNRQDHHKRIAVASFERVIRRYDGRLFRLENSDFVFACKGAELEEIEAVVNKLKTLFSEDPVASGSETGKRFTTWFDIANPPERDAFKNLADELYAQAEDRRDKERQSRIIDSASAGIEKPEEYVGPLTPELLSKLEESLSRMDIRGLIRRQPVCALLKGKDPALVFNELFITMAELKNRLMPGVDLFADAALFQRLTQSLDLRVLAALPEMQADLERAISINVNVSTLLSPEFLYFDSQLRSATKKSVVFELQTADIFSDMGAYMFAREYIHDRGYRFCLDGLTHQTFPLVNREDIGVDLKKMIWAPALADSGQEARREKLRAAVKVAEAARVILCRCDDQTAIEFGQAMGISLFQGRYVDGILSESKSAATV